MSCYMENRKTPEDGLDMVRENPEKYYKVIIDGLFRYSRLGHEEKELQFDDQIISAFLSTVMPERFEARIAELKIEKNLRNNQTRTES